MNHITVKYTLHHSAVYAPSDDVFVAKNNMDDTDLVELLTTLFLATEHFVHNTDGEHFARWVINNSDKLRAWLFGDQKIDETLEVESMGEFAEECMSPVIFNLESDYKERNIGLATTDGSKYDTIWFEMVDRDADVEQNKDELQSLTRQELIDQLSVALL